jgi:imidazolonepropionase-like amidohydrolase
MLALLAIAGATFAQTLDPTSFVVHPPAGADAFVFRHVGVVDAVLGTTRADMVVVVEGARITFVAPEGSAAVPDRVRSIDASGRYLIPGLWDMHVHGQGDWSESGPLLVTYGVTGIREVWGPNWSPEIHDAIESGSLLAPRAVVSGNMIDGPAPLNGERSLAADSPATARALVDSLTKQGVPFVKIYHAMSRDIYFALVERAASHSLPYIGHIPPDVSVIEASDAGQRSIEHLFGIVPACTNAERDHLDSRHDVYVRPDQSAAALVADFEPTRCRAVAERLAKNRTWVVPTLTALSAWYRLPDEPFGPHPLQVSPWQAGYWVEMRRTVEGYNSQDRAAVEMLWTRILEVVNLLHEAGVPLLAGSDAPNEPAYFGIGLHDELALLASAGLTAAEALQSATSAPAQFFGAEDELGTIEAGKLADLVLLEANPLEDIRNTRAIAAVVLNGRLIEREELLTAQLGVFSAIHSRTLLEVVPEAGVPTLEIRRWPEVPLSDGELGRYEGSYLESYGQSKIWLEKGRLRYETTIGTVDLVPMGDHVFATGRYRDGELAEIYWPDDTMVFYVQDGRVTGFRVMSGETAVFDAPRVGE